MTIFYDTGRDSMNASYRKIARGGMLLALALLAQSLRNIIPMPPWISMFLIGAIVNADLLIAVEMVGVSTALLIAAIVPVVAYMQQMLPLPVFIVPVGLGNAIYAVIYSYCRHWKFWGRAILPALIKTLLLYYSCMVVFSLVEIPQKIAANLMFAMSWPQLVTGLLGVSIAAIIVDRLKKIRL